MKIKIPNNHLFCLACVLFLFNAKVSMSESDLLVYPTHVVMTDRQRTAQVDIINGSQTQASYKISLARKRMTDTGAFLNISTPAPGEKFADEVVKFSPRQVTLVPGAGQTVRIMFKVLPNLPDGEYRSHLVFTRLASGIAKLPEKVEPDANTFSMIISANVGISIPVIARHGKLDAKAAIDPLSVKVSTIESKRQLLKFMLSRSGTRSIYGDIVVYRGEEKIAVGHGFSVYTPNNRRQIDLQVLDQYLLKSGDLIKIVFTEKDGKKAMAETSVVLP